MTTRFRLAPVRALVPLILATALVAPSAALAAPAVTNTNDSGAGSLRQAIADAAPGDTVAVPAGTYTLTSGQLEVHKTLTLAGAGARSTVVTAGGASRVLLTDGTPVRLSGMTITGGRLDITDVVDCQGGAGICNFSDLELSDVAVVGNVANVTANSSNAPGGGGVFNNGDSVSIVNSTIARNQANVTIMNSLLLAAGGAGFFNNGAPSTISNSTISDNALTVNGSCTQAQGCRHGGGGIYNNGSTVSVTNSTIANNSVGGTAPTSGGNFYVDNSPPSVFKNTIVSGGLAPSAPNCDKFGTDLATSSGGNVESANTCGFSAATDKRDADPLLAPLADNGGPTDTRALTLGSPAINAAVDCPPPATDQRGVPRPQLGGCDSGAFELQPPPAPVVPPAAPADTTKPTIHVKGIRRACLKKRVVVRVRISDASGIRSVVVKLDRKRIRRGVKKSGFKLALVPRKLKAGKHVLQIVAVDNAGNKRIVKKRFTRCGRHKH